MEKDFGQVSENDVKKCVEMLKEGCNYKIGNFTDKNIMVERKHQKGVHGAFFEDFSELVDDGQYYEEIDMALDDYITMKKEEDEDYSEELDKEVVAILKQGKKAYITDNGIYDDKVAAVTGLIEDGRGVRYYMVQDAIDNLESPYWDEALVIFLLKLI